MATPQYAMAHSGSSSITFAKAFSASSYSKECSRDRARLKSFFTFPEQDVSNPTEPNCLSGVPQAIISPLLRVMALIASIEGVFFFSLHAKKVNKNKPANNKYRVGDNIFIS